MTQRKWKIVGPVSAKSITGTTNIMQREQDLSNFFSNPLNMNALKNRLTSLN